ncbi:hypothetical protein AVEN_106174-1 [Araneus ventricosus]|uniref:DUF5641 domain-containing protein n=1 Tax=Araneus ventricosus TaxID=182803 RepID=A0A4Y2RER3_ARAVE|nr:hypothetical protein AVEN_106174-1 [Araneus ventricosus]
MSNVHSDGLGQFQKDNATPHASRVATNWLQEHSSDFRHFHWPPKYLEMNIIVDIRDALLHAVEKTSPPPRAPMLTALQDSLCEFPPGYIRTPVESMPHRFASLLRARGALHDIKKVEIVQKYLEGFQLADWCSKGKVAVLIGRNKAFKGQLVATETIFGRCLIGRDSDVRDVYVSLNIITEKDLISGLIKKFWELESLGIVENEFSDPTNDSVLQRFESEIKYENSRYTVRLPWKSDRKYILSDNIKVAERQFGEAGMTLHKRQTNNEELQKLWVKKDMVSGDSSQVVEPSGLPFKVLGVSWNKGEDSLYFDVQNLVTFLSGRVNSKRCLLHAIGRIFDPVGFLNPFGLRVKLLTKEIWKLSRDWDDDLPECLSLAWNRWCNEVPGLGELKISRYCFSNMFDVGIRKIELHYFSGAENSQKFNVRSSGNHRCLQDNLYGSSSFWVVLGIPPLHLRLERESRGTALYRLRLHISTNVIDINPSEIEEKATGWSAHPSEHLSSTQISLEDGGNINTGVRIYNEVLFFSGHRPFPSYLHRFNFSETSFYSCGWNWHTNTLCHRMSPHSRLPCETTQPTTSTNLSR